MAQRQEQQLERAFRLAARRSRRTHHHRAGTVGDREKHGGDVAALLGPPQVEKRTALLVGVEQGVHPCAGEPQRKPRGDIQHEGVGQDGADRGRVDVAALGRRAGPAQSVPIGEEFARRLVFH